MDSSGAVPEEKLLHKWIYLNQLYLDSRLYCMAVGDGSSLFDLLEFRFISLYYSGKIKVLEWLHVSRRGSNLINFVELKSKVMVVVWKCIQYSTWVT